MEGQIRHGLLYSRGSGRSGRLTGAAFGRQLLAKLLLKRAMAKTGPQKSRVWVFLQLASKPSALEPYRDSVHGGGVGLKSYCTDAENWHLHLSMFLTHKHYVVETEEMSFVETEQMFAAETRPLPPTPTTPAAGGAPSRRG